MAQDAVIYELHDGRSGLKQLSNSLKTKMWTNMSASERFGSSCVMEAARHSSVYALINIMLPQILKALLAYAPPLP